MQQRRGRFFILILLFLGENAAAQQGTFYAKSPHAYFYFLTPSGFSAPRGMPIYQNALIGINQYQKTTEIGGTTGLGMIPTLLLGEDYMPVWVIAHRRFPIGGQAHRPATVLNLGGFFLNLPKSESDSDFSLFYLNSTFGTPDKNIALGVAIAPTGIGRGVVAKALTIQGMVRLQKRSCLLTENYIIYYQHKWTPCMMHGWRGWKGRTAFDVAVLLIGLPSESGVRSRRLWLPLPWLTVHHLCR